MKSVGRNLLLIGLVAASSQILTGCPDKECATLQTFHDTSPRPNDIRIITVDPNACHIAISLKNSVGTAMGYPGETLPSMVQRLGAFAGLTGGFGLGNSWGPSSIKAPNGDGFEGIPLFALKVKGQWVSGAIQGDPDANYQRQYKFNNQATGAVGWKDGGKTVIWGNIAVITEVKINGISYKVFGLNQPGGAKTAVLHNAAVFAARPLVDPDSVQVVVAGGVVTALVPGTQEQAIPSDGFVYTIGNQSGIDSSVIQVGMPASTSVQINEFSVADNTPVAAQAWDSMDEVMGAGPILINAGAIIPRDIYPQGFFNFNSMFIDDKHPRGGICTDAQGNIKLIAVDGRNPGVSEGVSLQEFSALMRNRVGCVNALNLDGGGSTTMVYDGKLVNRPGGDLKPGATFKIRKTPDGIVVFR